ncbi:hypothetical protein BHE74_00046620, partial [Ensete ventricosum]
FEVTLLELLNMLREAESTIKKEKSVLYIGKTNRKGRLVRPLRRARAKKDRVSQRLLRNTRQRIKDSALTVAKMGIGRGTFLARPRGLVKGMMDLKIGNGAKVDTITIREVTLHLPGGVSLH